MPKRVFDIFIGVRSKKLNVNHHILDHDKKNGLPIPAAASPCVHTHHTANYLTSINPDQHYHQPTQTFLKLGKGIGLIDSLTKIASKSLAMIDNAVTAEMSRIFGIFTSEKKFRKS